MQRSLTVFAVFAILASRINGQQFVGAQYGYPIAYMNNVNNPTGAVVASYDAAPAPGNFAAGQEFGSATTRIDLRKLWKLGTSSLVVNNNLQYSEHPGHIPQPIPCQYQCESSADQQSIAGRGNSF